MHDPFRSVKEYLFYLQTRGTYSFTLEGAFSIVDKSQTAIKREIARLSKERKVRSIRRGFYVIVPPEYAVRGTRPVDLFIDDLMNYLDRAYYISLLSAGQLHGAAHQKCKYPMLRPRFLHCAVSEEKASVLSLLL